MKSMKDFAAQRLSKKEMNDVKGGMRTECLMELPDGTIINFDIISREDYQNVEREMQKAYEGIGAVSCQPWILN